MSCCWFLLWDTCDCFLWWNCCLLWCWFWCIILSWLLWDWFLLWCVICSCNFFFLFFCLMFCYCGCVNFVVLIKTFFVNVVCFCVNEKRFSSSLFIVLGFRFWLNSRTLKVKKWLKICPSFSFGVFHSLNSYYVYFVEIFGIVKDIFFWRIVFVVFITLFLFCVIYDILFLFLLKML